MDQEKFEDWSQTVLVNAGKPGVQGAKLVDDISSEKMSTLKIIQGDPKNSAAAAEYDQKTNTITMNTRMLDRDHLFASFVLNLGHELRHVWQTDKLEKGYLLTGTGLNGERLGIPDMAPRGNYYSRPHERDAEAYGQWLMNNMTGRRMFGGDIQ